MLPCLQTHLRPQRPPDLLPDLQLQRPQRDPLVERQGHRRVQLARQKVANFVNSTGSGEIVFTRNATEAINLVAYSWGLDNLRAGDQIVLTVAEHHSVIVPWQIVAQKTGSVLKFVSLTEKQVPNLEELKEILNSRQKAKLVAIHHVSNVLGSVLPVEEIVGWAHDVGAKVLVDACQSVPHMEVDVKSLGVDFLVASSHKMYWTYWGWFPVWEEREHSTYAEPPSRFEAGTPAIGEAIGLGAAVDYLSGIGMKTIHKYETELANYLDLASLCLWFDDIKKHKDMHWIVVLHLADTPDFARNYKSNTELLELFIRFLCIKVELLLAQDRSYWISRVLVLAVVSEANLANFSRLSFSATKPE
ncbi:hypothetical protein Scep_004187 [Stephania cephalantha]|uniref:Aminotransferase class V domain-containing protein n=1 Tax=Stephania cephalantha TaxID=152367 RepID=A0AAP0PV68_9MAGN